METQQHSTEAVVVGSGYGGSIAALRLAQAGIRTLVLERGRRWRVSPKGDTFATQLDPDGRASWMSSTSPLTDKELNVEPGILESHPGKGMTILTAAGLGGGSLVSNGTCIEPSRELFDEALGSVLDAEEMHKIWYPQARMLIGCAPIPEDVLNSPYYAAARSFLDQLGKTGIPHKLVDLAVDWDAVRKEMSGVRVASEIAGLNIFGVNSGAQRSLDLTVLAQAQATGDVDVRSLSLVTGVRPQGEGYVVEYDTLDDATGAVTARHEVHCRHLVLAAGTLGTTRMLMRARATGALPDLDDSLGTLVGNSEMVTARTGMPYNNPSQGGPSAVIAMDWEDNPHCPVTLLNFPWVDAPADQGWITAIGATPTGPLGVFKWNDEKGDVDLEWPVDNPRSQRGMEALADTLERLNKANPGTRTAFEKVGTTGGNVVGGAPLGKVTEMDGSVKGYRNLYVVDSALLHGAAGAVPSALTVAAVSACVVSRMVETIVKS